MPSNTAEPRTLVLACGALVREIRQVLGSIALNGMPIDVDYLPASLHNRPEQIPGAIRAVLQTARGPQHDRIVLGYGDCGTGGELDAEIVRLRAEGITVDRLPGNHCYEFFAGAGDFRQLHDQELGTFFATDFIARHFDTLIWQSFRFDEHPELIPTVFANYRRFVYLAQTTDPVTRSELEGAARLAADKLGLAFEVVETGIVPFGEVFVQLIDQRTGV